VIARNGHQRASSGRLSRVRPRSLGRRSEATSPPQAVEHHMSRPPLSIESHDEPGAPQGAVHRPRHKPSTWGLIRKAGMTPTMLLASGHLARSRSQGYSVAVAGSNVPLRRRCSRPSPLARTGFVFPRCVPSNAGRTAAPPTSLLCPDGELYLSITSGGLKTARCYSISSTPNPSPS
jgi:hypothetical protein